MSKTRILSDEFGSRRYVPLELAKALIIGINPTKNASTGGDVPLVCPGQPTAVLNADGFERIGGCISGDGMGEAINLCGDYVIGHRALGTDRGFPRQTTRLIPVELRHSP